MPSRLASSSGSPGSAGLAPGVAAVSSAPARRVASTGFAFGVSFGAATAAVRGATVAPVPGSSRRAGGASAGRGRDRGIPERAGALSGRGADRSIPTGRSTGIGAGFVAGAAAPGSEPSRTGGNTEGGAPAHPPRSAATPAAASMRINMDDTPGGRIPGTGAGPPRDSPDR